MDKRAGNLGSIARMIDLIPWCIDGSAVSASVMMASYCG